jgi:hypothetical protein
VSKLTTRRAGHFSRIAVLSFFPFSLLVAAQRPAHADPPPVVAPPTSSSSPAPTPPIATPISLDDLVITNDGSRYRGTIVESSSTQVQIALPTGKIQAIPRSNVSYAGPVSKAPADPGSSSPVSPIQPQRELAGEKKREVSRSDDDREFTLKLEATGGGDFTFHIREGLSPVPWVSGSGTQMSSGVSWVGQYSRLCSAPCTTELPIGSYVFAMSSGNGSPVEDAAPIRVNRPATITGTYHSHWGRRAVAAGIGVGGLALGIVIAVTSRREGDNKTCAGGFCSSPLPTYNNGQLIAGVAIAVIAPITGFILYLTSPDTASFEVSPLKEALRSIRLAPLVAGETPAGRTQAAPGLTLGGAF